MTNEIEIFENEEFGKIRTTEIDDKVLFCGSDVAKALGYSNTRDALSRHCKDVVKCDTLTNGGVQSLGFISEGDVYRLIMHSKLPSAEKFEYWVFDNVLPTIRKTGGYIANSELMVTTYFGNLPIEQQTLVKGLFDNIIAQQTKIDTLTTTNEVLTTDILSWADRPLVNALVRRYAGYACDGNFGSAWIEFKKELLYKYSININARITAYLNKTGKKTKPKTLDMISDDEVLSALKTIVSLCDTKKIDISDLLNKHKEV